MSEESDRKNDIETLKERIGKLETTQHFLVTALIDTLGVAHAVEDLVKGKANKANSNDDAEGIDEALRSIFEIYGVRHD